MAALATKPEKYATFMDLLKTKANNQMIYLGAKALGSGGLSLADYCWMTTKDDTGPQLTAMSYGANTTSVASERCLAVNTADPYAFYGTNCNDALNIVCEFGRENYFLLYVYFSIAR